MRGFPAGLSTCLPNGCRLGKTGCLTPSLLEGRELSLRELSGQVAGHPSCGFSLSFLQPWLFWRKTATGSQSLEWGAILGEGRAVASEATSFSERCLAALPLSTTSAASERLAEAWVEGSDYLPLTPKPSMASLFWWIFEKILSEQISDIKYFQVFVSVLKKKKTASYIFYFIF